MGKKRTREEQEAQRKYREENPDCVICGKKGTTHHIVNRSAGGGVDDDNFITLCSYHHDLVHRGEIEISRYL